MLRRVVVIPGETILKQGDVAKEMYVLESGLLRQTIRGAETPPDDDDDDVSDDMSVFPTERPCVCRILTYSPEREP